VLTILAHRRACRVAATFTTRQRIGVPAAPAR
jgi:hypothetical protein